MGLPETEAAGDGALKVEEEMPEMDQDAMETGEDEAQKGSKAEMPKVGQEEMEIDGNGAPKEAKEKAPEVEQDKISIEEGEASKVDEASEGVKDPVVGKTPSSTSGSSPPENKPSDTSIIGQKLTSSANTESTIDNQLPRSIASGSPAVTRAADTGFDQTSVAEGGSTGTSAMLSASTPSTPMVCRSQKRRVMVDGK